MLDKSGVNSDHLIRFQYISSLCKNTRDQKNISLKQASEKLKMTKRMDARMFCDATLMKNHFEAPLN
jgi:formate-dependent nitrite reductase cytochrome c552 subunit